MASRSTATPSSMPATVSCMPPVRQGLPGRSAVRPRRAVAVVNRRPSSESARRPNARRYAAFRSAAAGRRSQSSKPEPLVKDRVAARDERVERVLAEPGAEEACLRVNHHLARVIPRVQGSLDEDVELGLFWPRDH